MNHNLTHLQTLALRVARLQRIVEVIKRMYRCYTYSELRVAEQELAEAAKPIETL